MHQNFWTNLVAEALILVAGMLVGFMLGNIRVTVVRVLPESDTYDYGFENYGYDDYGFENYDYIPYDYETYNYASSTEIPEKQ